MKNENTYSSPAPYELALGSKEETGLLSIRVKKRTSDYFAYIAELYHSTTSAVINALLDSYVNDRADQGFERYLMPRKASTLLQGKIDEIANMDLESIFEADGWLAWYREDGKGGGSTVDPRKVWCDFEAGVDGANEGAAICHTVYIARKGVILLFPENTEKIRPVNDCCDDGGDIAIPYQKWPLFTIILQRAEEVYADVYEGCDEYEYTEEQIKTLLSLVDATAIDDKRHFVETIIGCITDFWLGNKRKTETEPNYMLLNVKKNTLKVFKYGVDKSARGFNGDLLQMSESMNNAKTKPIRLEIHVEHREPYVRVVNSWREFAEEVLKFVAQEKIGIVAKKFTTDKSKLRLPCQIADTPYYFESNENANNLGNLAVDIAREAKIKKLIVAIDW